MAFWGRSTAPPEQPAAPEPPTPENAWPTHPYYPLGLDLPHYVPNSTPVPILLISLAGMLGGVLLAASVVASRANPGLSRSRLAVFCWLVLCGSLHCFFEGYFVLNHSTLASSQNLFAQLWKEYALSDSRYLTSDPFMLSVESITAIFWGPLSFACAVCIVTGSPLRHPLQIIVCMAHLYGVALYYSTSLVETHLTGRSHSRPEFIYFWVYYFAFNLPWAIVPLFLLVDSLRIIAQRLKALEGVRSALRESSQKTRLRANEAKKTR